MSTVVEQRLVDPWETRKTLHGTVGTIDHKEMGRRYIAGALIFVVAGRIEALM